MRVDPIETTHPESFEELRECMAIDTAERLALSIIPQPRTSSTHSPVGRVGGILISALCTLNSQPRFDSPKMRIARVAPDLLTTVGGKR